MTSLPYVVSSNLIELFLLDRIMKVQKETTVQGKTTSKHGLGD
jgi:hypothetical protein